MLAVLLAASGCSDEEKSPLTPGTEDNIPDSSLPFPDTPEQLMANFQKIYETRDVDEYKLILDPAFETILQQVTIDEFPDVGAKLDATEENRIHDRMFSGNDLEDANGNFLPAIHYVSFSQFRVLVDWGESLPTDPIPDTLSAMYDVEINFDRGQEYWSPTVSGNIRFYVTTAEGRLNGQPKTYYRLVGQLDLTDGKMNMERTAWGSLKAMFH
jgi:hypothetical protein